MQGRTAITGVVVEQRAQQKLSREGNIEEQERCRALLCEHGCRRDYTKRKVGSEPPPEIFTPQGSESNERKYGKLDNVLTHPPGKGTQQFRKATAHHTWCKGRARLLYATFSGEGSNLTSQCTP